MTQPLQRPAWIQDTIRRYLGTKENKFKPYEPMQVQTRSNPFDPSAYYGQLELLRNFSTQATQFTRQQAARRQQLAEEKRRQEEIADMRKRFEKLQAIDLSQTRAPAQRGPVAPTKKGKFGSPLSSARISSGYGNRRRPIAGATTFHQGIDFAAPSGTPIYATHNGYVTNAGWSNGYGNNVSISTGGGVESFYGHQSKLAVKSGQYVQKGQIIGYVGSTGVSTGPHLHYGVKINGQWINPTGYY
jgi:murein DD-endopeptidase MepM/ murein hydrolase activator NlpD